MYMFGQNEIDHPNKRIILKSMLDPTKTYKTKTILVVGTPPISGIFVGTVYYGALCSRYQVVATNLPV